MLRARDFAPDGRIWVLRDDTDDPQATGMLSAIVAPLAARELPNPRLLGGAQAGGVREVLALAEA